jgi:hypothetical protein
MRAQAKPPRHLWPWIIVGTAIVVALAATAIALSQHPGAAPTASPSLGPTTTATSPTIGAEPDGCLGGADRSADMLTAAISAAGDTESGAVDVAASFVRWIQRYPYPSAQEAQQVGETILAKPSFTSDLPAYLAAQPDLSGGIVPTGTTYFMNTVPGVWYVESATSSEVKVTIGSGFVIEGSLSSTVRSSITITLVLENNRWKVAGAEGTRTPAELYKVGHPFTGGC